MTVATIIDRFKEIGHKVPETDVISRLNTLTDQFNVPVVDAERAVVAHFLRDAGIRKAVYYEGMGGGTQTYAIKDIPHNDSEWVSLRVKLVDIWENSTESIQQTGIIGDETGQIKYVMWRNAGLEDMKKGACYELSNIVTNEYNGRISVTFNKTSTITKINEDIVVVPSTIEYSGVIVAIKNGSGLIKRCKECNRAMRGGTCAEHGNSEGVYDLRIMCTLDNGDSTQDVVLNRELTESIWAHNLDDAVKMATDALDADVVADEMRTALIGKYYIMSGGAPGDMMIAKEFHTR